MLSAAINSPQATRALQPPHTCAHARGTLCSSSHALPTISEQDSVSQTSNVSESRVHTATHKFLVLQVT